MGEATPLLNVPGLEKWRQRLNSEISIIEREREELEARAGIDTKRLRERDSGFLRKEVRRRYFAIAEFDLREKLMRLERKEHQAHLLFWDTCIEDVEQALAVQQRALDRPPWLGAAFSAGLCVAAGAVFWRLVGAIGGAVVGFFVGQWVVSWATANAKEKAADFQREVEADRAERKATAADEVFGVGECAMGEPDFNSPVRPEFDRRVRAAAGGAG